MCYLFIHVQISSFKKHISCITVCNKHAVVSYTSGSYPHQQDTLWRSLLSDPSISGLGASTNEVNQVCLIRKSLSRVGKPLVTLCAVTWFDGPPILVMGEFKVWL